MLSLFPLWLTSRISYYPQKYSVLSMLPERCYLIVDRHTHLAKIGYLSLSGKVSLWSLTFFRTSYPFDGQFHKIEDLYSYRGNIKEICMQQDPSVFSCLENDGNYHQGYGNFWSRHRMIHIQKNLTYEEIFSAMLSAIRNIHLIGSYDFHSWQYHFSILYSYEKSSEDPYKEQKFITAFSNLPKELEEEKVNAFLEAAYASPLGNKFRSYFGN